MARSRLRSQPGRTLQRTALVHEAWVKLFHNAEPEFADRAHFPAVMSRVMRQVLIDHALGASADKQWGKTAACSFSSHCGIRRRRLRSVKVIDVDRACRRWCDRTLPGADHRHVLLRRNDRGRGGGCSVAIFRSRARRYSAGAGPAAPGTEQLYVTVEVPALTTVPPGVVTPIVPVFAPVGTVAVIWVSALTVNFVAFTPPKVTLVAPVKLSPLMVTTVPRSTACAGGPAREPAKFLSY